MYHTMVAPRCRWGRLSPLQKPARQDTADKSHKSLHGVEREHPQERAYAGGVEVAAANPPVTPQWHLVPCLPPLCLKCYFQSFSNRISVFLPAEGQNLVLHSNRHLPGQCSVVQYAPGMPTSVSPQSDAGATSGSHENQHRLHITNT